MWPTNRPSTLILLLMISQTNRRRVTDCGTRRVRYRIALRRLGRGRVGTRAGDRLVGSFWVLLRWSATLRVFEIDRSPILRSLPVTGESTARSVQVAVGYNISLIFLDGADCGTISQSKKRKQKQTKINDGAFPEHAFHTLYTYLTCS